MKSVFSRAAQYIELLFFFFFFVIRITAMALTGGLSLCSFLKIIPDVIVKNQTSQAV